MKKKYDIFISYRRSGGDMTAERLYESLKKRGYRVFLDSTEMGACLFDERLKDVIGGCKDFILVLTEGALDRCEHEDDWVRREIEWALLSGCRIIPVRERGFVFPKNVPEQIRIMDMHNGPQIDAAYWDSFVDRVCKDMKTRPFPWKTIARVGAALLLAAAAGIVAYEVLKKDPVQPAIDEQMLTAIVTAIETQDVSGLDEYLHVQIQPAPSVQAHVRENFQAAQNADTDKISQYLALAGEEKYAEALKGLEQAYLDGHYTRNSLEWLGYMYASDLEGVEPDYQKGAAYYELAVSEGSAYAANYLADLYYEGKGVEQDNARALELYLKAAELDEEKARPLRIGRLYAKEKGADSAEAQTWLENSLANSSAETLYAEGILCEKEKDYAMAEKLYQRAADMGYVNAMDTLGHLYYNDDLREPDYALALQWFEKAASLEDIRACAYEHMAWMYNKGNGTQKDEQKAIAYYEKAAEMGRSYSARQLGIKYGEKDDYAQALVWFEKAYALGDRDQLTLEWLGHLYSGTIEGIEADKERAIALCKEAVEMGSHFAANKLGIIYRRENDNATALAWYEKAAAMGRDNADTYEWLGYLYCSGVDDIPVDYEKGVAYYEKAVELGSGYAMVRIGNLYRNGRYFEKDKQAARDWYERALNAGYEPARKELEAL